MFTALRQQVSEETHIAEVSRQTGLGNSRLGDTPAPWVREKKSNALEKGTTPFPEGMGEQPLGPGCTMPWKAPGLLRALSEGS